MSHLDHLSPEAHHNRFFFYWSKFVVTHRLIVFGISFLITLLSLSLIIPEPTSQLSSSHHSGAQAPPQELQHDEDESSGYRSLISWFKTKIFGQVNLIFDTSVDAFNNPEDQSVKVLERYRDLFGRDDFFMVMIEGDVFSLPYLNSLRALHQELEVLNVTISSKGERRQDRLDRAQLSAGKVIEKDKTSVMTAGNETSQLEDLDDTEEWDDDEDDEDEWSTEDEGTVIEEVTSLINARRTQGTKGRVEVGEWGTPFPTESDLPQFKRDVLSDETLVGQLVGAKGRHSLILLRAHFMSEDDSIIVNREISRIAMRYHNPEANFHVRLTGMPQLNSTLKTTLLSTLRVLLILSMLLMIGMLSYQFRHILGVLPPLIVVAMAALNTFASMAIFGMPVTMLSNILPAFIICVGIGDSVHLLSVYRDQLKHHQDRSRAVIEAVSMTGTPILFTSLTTIVGLLSFRFASIPAIQDMGAAGAIGVAAACFHSLFILPAFLTFNRTSWLGLRRTDEQKNEQDSKADWLDRFINLISDSHAGVTSGGMARPESPQERRRRIITLWACGILTLLAAFGASKLKVWHNPLAWLPDGEPTKEAFAITDREVGGTANVQLLIHGGPDGMKDLKLLRGLEALKKHISSYQHPEHGQIIGSTINLNDIIKETRRALNEGDQTAYRLPDSREELAQLLFLFENSGPDQLRRLATNDLSSSQMTLRIKWLEATSYRGFTEHIREGISTHIPDYASVEPTGAVYTLVSTVGALLFDLVKSFGTALLVITLIMIFLLKGLKLGLLSMVPNLIPIVWLMGLMGFTGITIDMNNILIASIAIGLAVDDTIHLLHHFRVNYEQVKDPFIAINASLKHAGRAMLVTSTILTLGFFAYLAADMKNIQIFGLLIGLCAALAMLIDLIFAPALLRTFYPRTLQSHPKHI